MQRLTPFWPLLWSLLLFAGVLPPTASASEYAGVRQIQIHSQARGTDLDVTVWYPARAGGSSVTQGESVFFVGTPALRDAPLSDGTFPVVLLSHGVGLAGYAQALSWMAVPLAQQGFVVVAPTHPGNGGPHKSAAQTMQLWLKPADITESLNALEKDSFFAKQLDTGKVGVLGLSMGGYTALAMAGARIVPDRLAHYCDTDASNPSLCQWVRQSGVDLHAMDMRDVGRDNTDPRVQFAMAIDPGPVDVLDVSSLGGISIPVALVNLGRPGHIPSTVDASTVAKHIPNAAYAVIEDASHFSMFAECQTGAAQRAESAQIEEPICADGGVRPRSAIHAQLISEVVAAFQRALGINPRH